MPPWTHPIIGRTVLYSVVARLDVLTFSQFHYSMADCSADERLLYTTTDRTLSLGESRPELGLKINSMDLSVCIERLQCCLNLNVHVFVNKRNITVVMCFYVTYFPQLRGNNKLFDNILLCLH